MKRRQFILIGALVIAGILLFQNAYLAPRSEAMRGEIQSKYGTLQKYEAYLKGARLTEKEMGDVVAEMRPMEKRLMPEKSEFLASAGMQRIASELSAKSGLSVLTMRPLNAVKVNNFIAVPVYFEGTGNIRQLSDFLRAVEENPIMLKVEKLNINVTNMQNPKELRIKIQLSGMARI